MNLLSKTGLQYFWGKLKAFFVKGNAKVFFGTCDTAAATADKVVTCPSFTSADLDNGAMLLVRFDYANSASVDDITLNVNNTGAVRIRAIRNSATTTLFGAGDIRAITMLFTFSKGVTVDDTWYLIGADANTTYTVMSQDALTTGTSTTGNRISPKLLRDNFYTESEVDAFFTNRPTIVHLTDESDMPANPDANTVYMIDA